MLLDISSVFWRKQGALTELLKFIQTLPLEVSLHSRHSSTKFALSSHLIFSTHYQMSIGLDTGCSLNCALMGCCATDRTTCHSRFPMF